MKITTILIIAVLFLSLKLSGQNRIISGRVIAEDLEPLPMLDIRNTNTVNYGKTDMDGHFKISIPQEIDRLLFSYVGMECTEIILKKYFNFMLFKNSRLIANRDILPDEELTENYDVI